MNHKLLVQLTVCLSLIACLAIAASARAQDSPAPEPPPDTTSAASKSSDGLNLDMKLEDLAKQDVLVPGLSTPVSTVDRQVSTIGRSPNAVFVITPEMIKRTGARNIPEALRMAPGVDVARINAHTWAISIRGFNERFSNKLLVQIDGRIVYNPLFGGVYWEQQQDVVMEDIERIEVIRGPGTTMWGSNAENGVINILTKKSSDTQGAMIQSGGGDRERDFNTVRYGGKNDAGLSWRVWGQQFNRNKGWSAINNPDSWAQDQGGFRMEYAPSKEDTFTLQGDIYNGSAGELYPLTLPVPPFSAQVPTVLAMSGGNVLFRHNRVFDEDTSSTLLAYYDHYQRVSPSYREIQGQYNVDYQLQFSPADRHQCIAGTNYRSSPDSTPGTFSVSLNPTASTTYWTGAFLQDTMTLEKDRLYFTLGDRLEYNSYGKLQTEPTARLLFLPSERQSAWMAVSRAARMPTRDNESLNAHIAIGGPGVPVFFNTHGNPNIQPENVMAYEIGYRAAPTDSFSWDVAAYINDYRKLIGYVVDAPVVVPPYLFIPVQFDNAMHALTYGAELTATFQLSDTWRLTGCYSVFEANIQGIPGTELYAAYLNGSSPHNQVYLRSSWDIGKNLQFDVIGRYVDQLTFGSLAPSVPSYFVMDLRLGWQPTKNMEVSFVGQNLLDNHHLEFRDPLTGVIPTQVPSGFYGMLTWKY